MLVVVIKKKTQKDFLFFFRLLGAFRVNSFISFLFFGGR